MAPTVRQDTMELLDECWDMLGDVALNFDEITSLATSMDDFDNTKLAVDNGVDVSQQPTVKIQPPSPQPQLVESWIDPDNQPPSPEFLVLQPAAHDNVFDNTELLVDYGVDVSQQPTVKIQPPSPQPQLVESWIHPDNQPPSPDFLALQPAAHGNVFDNTKLLVDYGVDVSLQPTVKIQPISSQPQFEYLIDTDNQPASPEFLVLQPAAPEPLMQQALSPAPVPQQVLSPEPCDIQVQPFSVQQLDLPQLSVSPESPNAPSVLSPSSEWRQEEEEADSSATQEAANAPKKRGRKRKYPEGMAPSRRRPRKPKVYELEPLPDEQMEKKRKNAVNAKKHRDQQKQEKQKLSTELAEARAERDRLLQVVNEYKLREQQLLQVLSVNGINTEGLRHSLEGL